MITIKYTNRVTPQYTFPSVYSSLEAKLEHEAKYPYLITDYHQEDVTGGAFKEEEKEFSKKELAESDHEVLKYLAKKVRGKTNKKDDDDFEVLETSRDEKRKKIKDK